MKTELTPVDRLNTFLQLNYPGVKLHQVKLMPTPGWIMVGPKAVDIHGVGYPPRTATLRLWKELHEYFNTHVDVAKEKNGQATKILWQGCWYNLDQHLTYREGARRNAKKVGRKAVSKKPAAR